MRYGSATNSDIVNYQLPPIEFDNLTKFQAVGYRINGLKIKDVPLDFRFRLKLEKGNKVTTWTPAPEDIETSAVARTQRIYWRATSTASKPGVNNT